MKPKIILLVFSLFLSLNLKAQSVSLKLDQILVLGEGNSNRSELMFSGIRLIKSTKIGSRIFVADMSDNSIRVFNSESKFLSKIGGRGRGPGEFLQVTSFEILDDQSIVVLDRFLNRVTYFDSVGTVTNTISLGQSIPVNSAMSLYTNTDDNTHYILYRDYQSKENSHLILNFDTNFESTLNSYVDVFKYFYDSSNPLEFNISQRPAYLSTTFGTNKVAIFSDTFTGTFAIFDKHTKREALIGNPIQDHIKLYDWNKKNSYSERGETGYASLSTQQGKYFFKLKGSNFGLVGNSNLLLQFFGKYVGKKIEPYLNIFNNEGKFITTIPLQNHPVDFISDRNTFSIIPHFLDENYNLYVSDYDYKGKYPAVRVFKTNLKNFVEN